MEGTLEDGFTEIPTGVTADAAQPDLALTFFPAERQHLVYRHGVASGIRAIRYIRRDGAGFTTPVDVSPADAFYTQPSLTIRDELYPHVVYVSNTTGFEGFYLVPSDGSTFLSPIELMTDPDVLYNETDPEAVVDLVRAFKSG